MPIAIDSSTPARFTGAPANDVDIASASFTPPANSVLVVHVNADSQSTQDITIAVSDSQGLTWTNEVERDLGDAGAEPGHASIWTAKVITSTAMTVSVRRTAGNGGTNRISVKPYVVTGADTTDPVGATGEGTSTTNNLTANAYTSTVNNSRGFGCATDWNQNGLPTSTDTEDAADYAGAISVISLHKAADTPTSGTGVTMNFDSAGASPAAWNWVAVEIKPAAGGAAVALDGIAGGRSSSQSTLAVARSLTGRATGQGRTTGAASILRGLAASVTGRSSAQAPVTILRALAGAIAGRSTTLGDFAVGGFTQLLGMVAGRSSAQGALSVVRNLGATVAGGSTVQSAINVFRRLIGTAQGIGRAIGALFLASELLNPLSIDDRIIEDATWEDDRTIESATWEDDRVIENASWEDSKTIEGATWEDDRTISTATWEDSKTIELPLITMTAIDSLNPIAKGDARTVRRTFKKLPSGSVISKAWLTIKSREKDADAQALIQKDITTALTAKGQITDADTTDGQIAMVFEIAKEDTAQAAIKVNVDYPFDIQVLRSTGQPHTLVKGTVRFFPGVTDANS